MLIKIKVENTIYENIQLIKSTLSECGFRRESIIVDYQRYGSSDDICYTVYHYDKELCKVSEGEYLFCNNGKLFPMVLINDNQFKVSR